MYYFIFVYFILLPKSVSTQIFITHVAFRVIRKKRHFIISIISGSPYYLRGDAGFRVPGGSYLANPVLQHGLDAVDEAGLSCSYLSDWKHPDQRHVTVAASEIIQLVHVPGKLKKQERVMFGEGYAALLAAPTQSVSVYFLAE